MMVAEAVESFERKVIALVGVGMSMIMILVGVLIINHDLGGGEAG